MFRRALVLIIVLGGAALVLPTRASSQTATELHYRLVIYGPAGGPAPAGTSVRVVNAATGAVCVEEATVNGLAEVEVALTSACPAGAPVQVIVAYPGQDPEAKPVSPPIEWRAPVSGDPQPITVGVGGDGPPVLASPQPSTPAATPARPGLASGCGTAGPAISGGRTTGLGNGKLLLQVTLPAPGSYFTLPSRPAEEIGLMVCNIDNNASVVISAVTGRELSRSANNPAGSTILDQIVASATLTVMEAPPTIVPPGTGDAGLKRERTIPQG